MLYAKNLINGGIMYKNVVLCLGLCFVSPVMGATVATRIGGGVRYQNQKVKGMTSNTALDKLGDLTISDTDEVDMKLKGVSSHIFGKLGVEALFCITPCIKVGLDVHGRLTGSDAYFNGKDQTKAPKGTSGEEPSAPTAETFPVVSDLSMGSAASTLNRKHRFSIFYGVVSRIFASQNVFFTVGAGIANQEAKWKFSTFENDYSKESDRVWQFGIYGKVGSFYRTNKGLYFGAEAEVHRMFNKDIKIQDGSNVDLSFKSVDGIGTSLSVVVGYDFIKPKN
ncbi:MAG: hypothetical protein H6845_00115 [Alphaproteobacteria bacterium]|nr:MAG: hypothetical protein H6845_00115 [Alphaproteobacteria bacterium]